MKVIELANGSRSRLEELATRLGSLRRSLDFPEFQSVLMGIGMECVEAWMFWNAMDVSFPVRKQVCANTRFSSHCGIALKTRILPRNLLLFRLIELTCKNALVIQMRVAPHRGEVKRGKWNFLDEDRKKILHLKFLPKKPRPIAKGAWYLD